MRQSRPLADRFVAWWRRPPTSADRFWGATCGAFAGLWTGAIGRMAIASVPVSLADLAIWAIFGIACGVVVGHRFPKIAAVVFFPFVFLGISPGS
jgi:hypothetical protein